MLRHSWSGTLEGGVPGKAIKNCALGCFLLSPKSFHKNFPRDKEAPLPMITVAMNQNVHVPLPEALVGRWQVGVSGCCVRTCTAHVCVFVSKVCCSG